MSEKRINPDTGVVEEKHWYGWEPARNAEGREERVNPEAGVREERHWYGWESARNAEGREERVNPEAGVREERHWYGWESARNAEGREERVNPETGVHEEKYWYGWSAKEGPKGGLGSTGLALPQRRPMPRQTDRQGSDGYDDRSRTTRERATPQTTESESYGRRPAVGLPGLRALLLVVAFVVALGLLGPGIRSIFNGRSGAIPESRPAEPLAPRPRTIAPGEAPDRGSSVRPREAIIQNLIQEQTALRQDLDWLQPPQVVLTVPATFQFGVKPYRTGQLTILTDGIEIQVPNGGRRWQFWKLHSMEIGRVLMTSHIKFTFDPLYSGAEDASIVSSSGDFVLDPRLEALFKRIQSVHKQWMESDIGQRQLSARTRLKSVENEIARLQSASTMDPTVSIQALPSSAAERYEGRPPITTRETSATCYEGIWAENDWNQFRWDFTTMPDGRLHIRRNDGFVAGIFVRTQEGWTGTLKWGNGETWRHVLLYEPNGSCKEIRTNQSWWFRRR